MIMGNKPAYPPWPHSVCLPEGLAGGRAPSNPCVSGPPRERWAARCSNPQARRGGRPGRRDPRRIASRELGRDRHGLEEPPVGGALADSVAGRPSRPPTLGRPLSRRFWAFCGGSAESEAAGSPVTHQSHPRKGRSTPGFGLPTEELDIPTVDDRARERRGVSIGTENVPAVGIENVPAVGIENVPVRRRAIRWQMPANIDAARPPVEYSKLSTIADPRLIRVHRARTCFQKG